MRPVWRAVDIGPHCFMAAPTKRQPHRMRCLFCDEHARAGDEVAARRLCSKTGDLEAVLNANGVEVRLWASRGTTGSLAVVEAPWGTYTWERGDRRARRPSQLFLEGFAAGLLAAAEEWADTQPPDQPRRQFTLHYGGPAEDAPAPRVVGPPERGGPQGSGDV